MAACFHTVCEDFDEDSTCRVQAELELVSSGAGQYQGQSFEYRDSMDQQPGHNIAWKLTKEQRDRLRRDPDQQTDFDEFWVGILDTLTGVDEDGRLWRLAHLYEGAPDLFAVAYKSENTNEQMAARHAAARHFHIGHHMQTYTVDNPDTVFIVRDRHQAAVALASEVLQEFTDFIPDDNDPEDAPFVEEMDDEQQALFNTYLDSGENDGMAHALLLSLLEGDEGMSLHTSTSREHDLGYTYFAEECFDPRCLWGPDAEAEEDNDADHTH